MNFKFDFSFWKAIDDLVNQSEIIIDRGRTKKPNKRQRWKLGRPLFLLLA